MRPVSQGLVRRVSEGLVHRVCGRLVRPVSEGLVRRVREGLMRHVREGLVRRVREGLVCRVHRRLLRGGLRRRLLHGLHDGLRCGRGDLVAPRALGTRQQQQVFVLGGGLGEVGVRTVRRDARLLHHACVLRQPLARDLAGVGHAYPSPIG
ncbi:hypothetical protein B1R27_33310 [Streptomyces sp. GKU 895]|nr:hypothetical protein B1R27_33310 [Streptomyces sp. GKU 895]